MSLPKMQSSYLILNFLCVWLLCELCFFAIIFIYVHKYLQKPKKPPKYDMDPSILARRVLEIIERLNTYDHFEFFEGFFCGSKKETIYKDNLRSFLAWVMYASNFDELDENQIIETDKISSEMCNKLDLKLKPGYNKDVRHVKMTIEPLLYTHRPFFIYVATYILNKAADFFIMFYGFKRYNVDNKIHYWHRPAKLHNNPLDPIIFFHGITTGWFVYWPSVIYLGGGREIFLFDLDGIKINSLSFDMLSSESYCEHVRRALDRHNVCQVSVVGHSFGTITAGWMVKNYPDYVSHLTLIDPVSLLLALPDVAYNFLYREPSTIVQWVIYIMASREITVSNALRRNFWWYKNVLWLDDMPARIGVLVTLGGNDEVAKTHSIEEYVLQLKAHRYEGLEKKKKTTEMEIAPVTCLFFPGHSHAEILFRTSYLQQMAQVLHKQEAKKIK